MAATRRQYVPASLVRIRCFMGASMGTRVKPWATADQTLDAFQGALASRSRDDRFWADLESLLAALDSDVRRRLSARGPGALDNELLDPSRRKALLAEIRAALHGRTPGRGAFRRLASALSMPAAGLLVVLGGAVTLGCEHVTGIEGDADADSPADTAPDTFPDTPADTSHDTTTDTLPDPPHDTATDDAACDPADDAACPHLCETLEQILEECWTEDPDRRQHLIDRINVIDSSWRTGLTDLFQCEDCATIMDQIYSNSCLLDRDPVGEFDLDTWLDTCSCCIYVAVRFD